VGKMKKYDPIKENKINPEDRNNDSEEVLKELDTNKKFSLTHSRKYERMALSHSRPQLDTWCAKSAGRKSNAIKTQLEAKLNIDIGNLSTLEDFVSSERDSPSTRGP
ncbi:hypothetical protein KI387_032633, partial [Taxus chinensis]